MVPGRLLILSLVLATLLLAGGGFYFWSNQAIRTNPISRLFTSLPGQKADTDESPALPFSEEVAANASVAVTYEGTLPCADCEGLHTSLVLDPSPDDQPTEWIGSTYHMTETYLGKSVPPIVTQGTWIIQSSEAFPNARVSPPRPYVVLDHLNPAKRRIYWMENDSNLIQLDPDGNEFDSPVNFALVLKGADLSASPEVYPAIPPDFSPPSGAPIPASPSPALP